MLQRTAVQVARVGIVTTRALMQRMVGVVGDCREITGVQPVPMLGCRYVVPVGWKVLLKQSRSMLHTSN